jgi:hypothetical protein
MTVQVFYRFIIQVIMLLPPVPAISRFQQTRCSKTWSTFDNDGPSATSFPKHHNAPVAVRSPQ